MRAVIQRVSRASVEVDGVVVASIGVGLLVLVAVTHTDEQRQAEAMAAKIHGLRILRDERSVGDLPGSSVLLVSQFTLYGDARKGRRPTWAAAAPGSRAEPLVEAVAAALRAHGAPVETGIFGADMRVDLTNDGPFTVLVEI